MGIFTLTPRQASRRSDLAPSVLDRRQGRESSDGLRELPARFEALGEALAGGGRVEAVCTVIGRELARDGVDMAGALGGLRTTYLAMAGREPDFAATHALSLAWSDETLAYLHQLSCEDPLTGLASLAHLRARLSEFYRGVEQREESTTASHALVVVDLPQARGDVPGQDRMGAVMWSVRTAETVRWVFPGEETIAQVAAHRLVVVTRRDDLLGRRVAALRSLIGDVDREGSTVRVWIEGLPSTDAAAGVLLDELART